jgi:hydrogenase maturation protein HypF
VYISQYLGNTDGFEAQQAYRHTLAHLQGLIQAKPQMIITDNHPLYFSHELGHELAKQYQVPLVTVQHHKAHFAAILAEQNLLNSEKPVLGVIWDGTGLGDDGNSWGGEFFVYVGGEVSRPYHAAYFPYLLGDKMAREPRLSALSIFYANHSAGDESKRFFTEQEWEVYRKMLGKFDGILTSSVGRMFDAVACLLTGLGKQSYEGEAAMHLEAMARQWFIENGTLPYDPCCWETLKGHSIPFEGIFKRVINDHAQGKNPGEIAFFFHEALVELILLVAKELNITKLAFSGGVWQNSLLVDRIKAKAPKETALYFHQQLSPNDENISFGQLVWYDNNLV